MSNKTPVIAGVADVPLQKGMVLDGANVLNIQANAALEALESAGLTLADVDGLMVTGMWGIPGPGQLMSVTLAEYLGIHPTFHDCTNIGGSTFEIFVARAAMAIEAGQAETVLILYGSTQRSEQSRNLAGRAPIFNMQYETPTGMPTPVGGYAMAMQRHMHEYGSTPETLAEIAVATRKWAQMNENATKRDELTIDDVMNSPVISSPLRLRDCCLVTDGGGAVVVTTKERAKDLKKKPIYIKGYGECATHRHIAQMPDMANLDVARIAGERAFKMAGMRPSDIDVTQIYDSFTVTVLLTLEALGFAKPGEGKDLVANQNTAPGGNFPLNTSGGGLSYAHPGMFGIFLLIEAARQLWGECGERQVVGVKTALCHGTGGTLSSGATCILSTEEG